MAIQGQRFHIDLEEAHHDGHSSSIPPGAGSTGAFNIGLVGDIKERIAFSNPRPPSPPRHGSSQTGFPAHRVRTGPSRFKIRNQNQPADASRVATPDDSRLEPLSQLPVETANRDISMSNAPDPRQNLVPLDASIDEENRQRLTEMSDQEIEEARQELMAGLSPSLIEKLLKKANIDEGRSDSHTELHTAKGPPTEGAKKSAKAAAFGDSELPPSTGPDTQNEKPFWDPDAVPLHPPLDLHPASSYPSTLPQPPDIHFPNPPQAPDLDPSDPDFLSALHSTYFPNLPADPAAMAWMTPLSPEAEGGSAYSPSQESHSVSAVRFDFRGHLLPPRLSAQIASTKGLHHHAHAPASAGYTVPELSHLARSSYSAQRCIAYQTLGRILYRLGRGDFGQEGEDLCEGLWQLVEQGKVVDQLIDAAAKGDSGNRSVWVTATEAVWLWRKGGGRRWRAR